MIKRIVNIGVLAHVDAGKTSLTERLLFDNGAIHHLGSVDAGNTTTDSNDIERERGITIRSAVAAFALGDLQVNLVDTPGHPDFIAEVERAFSVLDGAVLVISAVEGVQAQTKVLLRSLRMANVPTLIFINKIDRKGARPDALMDDIRRKLVPSIVSMNDAVDAGTPGALVVARTFEDQAIKQDIIETLTEYDLDMLAKFMDKRPLSTGDILNSLKNLTAACQVFPVFCGSALLGMGSRELAEGIRTLLPSHENAPSPGIADGVVFAIERLVSGEKIAYLRLKTGELRERDEVKFIVTDHRNVVHELNGKVTGLNIVGEDFRDANTQIRSGQQNAKVLMAGNIGKVRGLTGVRVGAHLGSYDNVTGYKHFPPPTLEAIVHPRQLSQQQDLYAAITSLSDEDPLIRARLTVDGHISILLYGDVQKEVIAERLMREFGVETEFSATSPIYVERPIGVGEAEYIFDPRESNDFWATIGIRLVPNAIGTGNTYVRAVPWGQMPAGFYRAIEESAMETLEQGLRGWQVTDCAVHLVKLDYERPMTVAADFRCLTPILLMRALQMAGTRVYEPCQSFELEVSDDSLGNVITFLSTHDAKIDKTEQTGPATWAIFGDMPVRVVQAVTVALPPLTHGEALLMLFSGPDRAVRGVAPVRSRTDGNPLDYHEYMRHLTLSGLMR